MDLATGDRVGVSSLGLGSGPTLSHPHGAVWNNSGGFLYVCDRDYGGLFAVEPGSGDRVLVIR